jgi:hypothetical protein
MPWCFSGTNCNDATDAAGCTSQGGTVVASCPSAGLVGCCTVTGQVQCFYAASGSSAETDQAICSEHSGAWVGTGLAVCPGPTASLFSSEEGLVPALCVAQAWNPQAFLVGIEFGLAAPLQPDGTDASWSYSFSAPNAACPIPGGSGNEKIQIQVDSSAALSGAQISSPGNTCGSYTALTGEADSTTVVPAAAALLMPMVTSSMAAGSQVYWYASDPVEGTTQVGYVGGSAKVWAVMASWTVSSPTGDLDQASETFDANGANPMLAARGPCNPTTFTCP